MTATVVFIFAGNLHKDVVANEREAIESMETILQTTYMPFSLSFGSIFKVTTSGQWLKTIGYKFTPVDLTEFTYLVGRKQPQEDVQPLPGKDI